MTHNMFLFSNDLRIQDNKALQLAARHSSKLCLAYAFDANERRLDSSDCRFMGNHRYYFIQRLLRQLQIELADFGQHLEIIDSDGVDQLAKFINELNIDTLFCSAPLASYEKNKLRRLKEMCGINIITSHQHTLFTASDLPFAPQDIADSFSKFRRLVEKHATPIEPCLQIVSLPSPLLNQPVITHHNTCAAIDSQQQLTNYFNSNRALTYKQTRNDLDKPLSSTKLSAALAQGALSARQVWWALKAFEHEHGANQSTYWIGFELLWREYFHWLLLKFQDNFFRFTGINGKRPATSFYPQRFKAYCSAQTPSAFVNAIINQLTQTGYISNRARQIAASFFVNEFALDWRFGARFFQMHLIDYDVANNWGNWQYIAGVGSDPRGGRHFNIAKQQQLYDPHGEFVQRWQGKAHQMTYFSDIVDWPVENAHSQTAPSSKIDEDDSLDAKTNAGGDTFE
ncbi:DASH family cryptochrome [Thalassotalea maritima]|uniref:DASH family cryptochrome n=1 Tax=Thalassotalea maritima TaxID=3242416 RepID=UPI0035270EBA